ncbi:peptidoglycan editing factor PgeF [Methylomonas methanica]|uniref:Purine nucleoside phosphorylase n=1 Tax=Methylomonas methanica (strain DSM 25384 / MC09) TaxID=857087 RepID=G0A3Z5_METMM|nr:peptidoglycan editing factor PgeF [Methylomonas methanica]AEG02767.1 Multi-copper polyphenol oxidoreductase, laccase [Methylomonas methanica MC09]
MNWIKPDWPLPAQVHAATTVRNGGVSVGAYASLNPAGHVNDDPQHVSANRRIIKEMLKLPAEPVWLQQVHGIEVVQADSVHGQPEADASFTDRAATVCAVLTADCLPVLFCGDDGAKIAAAHAGWRGLQAGVIKQTLSAMQCREVSVWLGPAIGPQNFEVGDEVREAFVSGHVAAAQAFSSNGPGKWLADIYRLARLQLAELGVERVYGGGYCTVADARFYSYRRDGAATGRMASLIWRD